MHKTVKVIPVAVAQPDTTIERIFHGILEVAEGVHLATLDRHVRFRESGIRRVRLNRIRRSLYNGRISSLRKRNRRKAQND